MITPIKNTEIVGTEAIRFAETFLFYIKKQEDAEVILKEVLLSKAVSENKLSIVWDRAGKKNSVLVRPDYIDFQTWTELGPVQFQGDKEKFLEEVDTLCLYLSVRPNSSFPSDIFEESKKVKELWRKEEESFIRNWKMYFKNNREKVIDDLLKELNYYMNLERTGFSVEMKKEAIKQRLTAATETLY